MSQKSRPISDLGLDDALTTFVGQKLSARFQVEPVEFDRAKFSAVQEPGFLKTLSLPPIHDLVQNLTAPVDAYLVISKDLVAYGLNDDILRPGLNIGRGGFHEDEYEANAFIMLSVFDAHTHALLAMIDYPPPISHFWGGKVETLPLDGALWPDNDGNFTQPQLDKLKTLFSDDLDGIVSKSMEQLGLLPQQ